ncbi:YggS family pyridoxal phosphate-dependent enzyme [Clostridium sp. B9]|uniref:YggS family pyridoxal phosphate-dependent enzyme n=1 Tax=Clostridium sp. B9 TaxID=3423224 RepID=UPI003D2F0264
MEIKENLVKVTQKIPDNVQLIAVSKTKTIEEMEEAYDFGIRKFGENKVQEIIRKFDEFHQDVEWHLIGHLQTNKVKYIVDKVHLIQSLDSVKLLKEIEKVYGKHNKIANTLIQVNIGREEQKYGILEEELDELIEAVEDCNSVNVLGIMTIIPKGTEDENRAYFKKAHKLFCELKERKLKNIKMDILSMGMSNDFEIAIEEGSNMVRVGQGIFGARIYK